MLIVLPFQVLVKDCYNLGPILGLPNAFNSNECDAIAGKVKEYSLAPISYNWGAVSVLDPETRDNYWDQSLLLSDEQERKFSDILLEANERFYKFQINDNEIIETLLAKYQPGQHFSWHTDYYEIGRVHRKLSGILQLTPEDQYTGGWVEILKRPWDLHDTFYVPRDQGYYLIFPSLALHKVHAVRTGLRNSFVTFKFGVG